VAVKALRRRKSGGSAGRPDGLGGRPKRRKTGGKSGKEEKEPDGGHGSDDSELDHDPGDFNDYAFSLELKQALKRPVDPKASAGSARESRAAAREGREKRSSN
jgi:hypothetical protein